jgi:glycosyltransferase involved in cell wall biosynthesis
LSKYWHEISKGEIIYGSGMNSLPFLNHKGKHVVNFTYIAEAVRRTIDRPEYGEEIPAQKKHLEEAKATGINFDYSKEEYYRLIKEAQETIIRTGHSIVVPNRNAKEDLLRYYDISASRIAVLPYGLEESWFSQSDKCADCEHLTKNFDQSKPLLIYYAYLNYGLSDFLAQGIDRIMETFQRIRELQKLVILNTNDPCYRKLFQKRGAQVIENPSAKHLQHIFKKGQIFLQTARYETRNLPMMQAMASKMAIVSFPVGLAEECIETGKNGFLVQNLIQMIAKVDFLRNNPEKAKNFGDNSFAMAKHKFNINKIAEQYLKYFSNNKVVNDN